jgi:hypothetical protein
MTGWTSDALTRIGNAEELELCPADAHPRARATMLALIPREVAGHS